MEDWQIGQIGEGATEEERRQEEERLMSLAIALSVSQQENISENDQEMYVHNTSEDGRARFSAEAQNIDPMLTTVQMNSEAIFKLMEAQSKDREATSTAMIKLLEHHSKDYKETTNLIMKVVEKQSQDSHETATSLQHQIQLQNKMIEQQNEDRKGVNEKLIQLIDQQNKDRLSALELYKSLQIMANKSSNSTPDCPMCSNVTKIIFCGHFYCPNCHSSMEEGENGRNNITTSVTEEVGVEGLTGIVGRTLNYLMSAVSLGRQSVVNNEEDRPVEAPETEKGDKIQCPVCQRIY